MTTDPLHASDADRQMVVTGLVSAPRGLVWQMFTDPAQVALWWAPNGFTVTNPALDLQSGGVWRFGLRGPGGTGDPNRARFTGVSPPGRLTDLRERGVGGDLAYGLEAEVTLTEEAGRTRVALRMICQTVEQWRALTGPVAVEDGEEMLARLGAYASGLAAPRLRVDYDSLEATIASLAAGETDAVALMATVACEVHHADDRFDWTGFYRVVGPELLKIGPYQGGHGCLVIPFSRGVCGAAARTGRVQLVPDVDAFPGHIACASSTRSELVLPVWNGAGQLLGVFDIDSDQPDAFDQTDADRLAAILASVFAGAS